MVGNKKLEVDLPNGKFLEVLPDGSKRPLGEDEDLAKFGIGT